MQFPTTMTRWFHLFAMLILFSGCASGNSNSTLPPSEGPTMVPTHQPSASPTTSAPTAAPSKAPSPSPSAKPSASPSDHPTDAPTAQPTQTPTSVSSKSPTMHPSAAPSFISASPSDAPTEKDATQPPTGVQSSFPSAVPSKVPSGMPSLAPSISQQPSTEPSSQPSTEGTGSPSLSSAPSDAPTPVPTKQTEAPTKDLIEETVVGLSMVLTGISDLPEEDQGEWESVTAQYQVGFFNQDGDIEITDFEAVVTVSEVITPASRQLRYLEEATDEVTVVYQQTMKYQSTTPQEPSVLAVSPFEEKAGRDAYVGMLVRTGQGVLADIQESSIVTAPTESPTAAPSKPPTDGGGDDDGLGTGVIIGIAVGGGVVLIALVLFFFFRSGDNEYEGANDPPPSVDVKRGGDEVSTLAAPQTTGAPASNESITGYGDQSVATVDYDYSKAYGGGGDTSVSSAGGTFGSQTQGQSVLDPSTATATGAALGGAGSFSDADSFEAAYRDPNANVREELINIFAPPGKLGVVIDTPDDGAPVVHAVKDSSVIANKIHVGDKLVAVDDEDVRSMTAIKVSKLISRKSANPSRKLSVIRTTVVD